MIKRIGFVKFLHSIAIKKTSMEEIERPLLSRCTTFAWLNRQTKEDAEQRLWDLMVHNIKAFENLVEYVEDYQMNYIW